MLMILFVVPVGNVVGQTNSANAIRIDVYEKCEFKTMELYKFQQAWFVFQSKDSLTQITVADHIATYAPAPVFDTVIVYDKNMTIVAVFSEDSADWSEIVSTPMVGSDYYLYVKSNSYFDKCDFDMCLINEKDCHNEIEIVSNVICANDPLCINVTNCNLGQTLIISVNGAIYGSQPAPQLGTTTTQYCFSNLGLMSGTFLIEACLYNSSTSIYDLCDVESVSVLASPIIEIAEGENITICPGNYCFHDISTDASDIEWTLYYYYPGIGWDSFQPINGAPNSQYCHLFTDIGLYYLVSTATNNCGIDSDTINIEVVPPSAEFTWTNACLGSSVCFTELSNCEEYWHWDFGDGATSSQQNPCHEYAQAGNYLVTLEVASGIIVSHTITVYSPVQPIITGDESACESSSHYQVTPAGAFSQIGWAVNSPSGWVSTVPSDEYNHSWTNGTGGVVYVETTDNNGCVAHGEMMVFDCCAGGDISWYNTQIVETGTIYQKTIVINGTQNVLQSGTHVFINGCTILMGPNAKVTIEDGAWVRIGKSIIEACNGLMWDGLFVENGGYLELSGNTMIKDAKNAVVSIDGGECVIDANHFDKNFRHIVIEPYNSSHSAVIERNHLECSGTILPQYPPVIAFRTQDAITVNSVGSIVIGEKNAGNTISNCDIGILSMNSFIRVVGNTFSNIEPPSSLAIGQPNHPRGYGIYTFSFLTSATNPNGLSTMPSTLSKSGGNTFTNVTNGIYSFNNGQVYIAKNTFNYQNNPMGHGTAISLTEWSHPATNKTITVNTINNYNKGILVASTNNARVSGNTISNLKLMPIPLSNLRAMGIRIEGGSNNVVQGNTVQNNSASSADWRWEGISVFNSGSLVVSCNTLRKMGKSIRFQGVNDPVQIKKNFMHNGTAGIVLSDNGFINEQGTSGSIPATATTPGNGIPWDNEWYGFSSRHLYTMNYTNASNIYYHIFSGTSPRHPANFNNGAENGSQSFNSKYENGSLFMLCAIPLMSASPEYSSWMNDVAANTNANLQSPMHRNWMGRNGLYKTLKEDSLLSQNASLQSFVQQLETESQGVLRKVQDTLLMNDYLAAKIMNDILIPSTKPDSVFRDINSVFINAVMTNSNDWTTAISQSGLDSLEAIAELCPFEYGEMVYLSRIMLKMFGDTTEYFNECEADEISVPGKSMMSTNNEMFVNVFPNPASSEITIETDVALPATVTFYSALGQIILIQDLYNESSIIDIRTISEQLVLYEIKGLNGEIARGLLQISR